MKKFQRLEFHRKKCDKMKRGKLHKFAILVGGIGLIIILSVILSGVAYPNVFFNIGTFLGLLFIFIGVILLFIGWIRDLHDAVKKKQYLWAALIAMVGLIIILKALVRIL